MSTVAMIAFTAGVLIVVGLVLLAAERATENRQGERERLGGEAARHRQGQ